MKNPIIRKVDLTATYTRLSATPLVGTFYVRCPAAAVGIYLRCDDGVTDLPLDRGGQWILEGWDLSTVYAKGGSGDYLIVIGVTR